MSITGLTRVLSRVPPFGRFTAILITLILGSACSSLHITGQPPRCDFGDVRLNSDFSGGRMDGCTQTGSDRYVVTLSPENSPINHSPWYSFRVESDTVKAISITLAYTEHRHRYKPKLSNDGKSWRNMPNRDVNLTAGGTKTELSLEVGPSELWVSAQEIIDNEDYAERMAQWARLPYIEQSELGKSVEGRTIEKLETVAIGQKAYIILVGRQHPPEVTGALAMMAFIDRVLADDDLAVRFREKFGILMVPNMNPDGVHAGNWRHNAQGIDLNRDWGPFTQPETRLMRDEVARFHSPDTPRLYLFLDFHSTAKDVFYAQLEDMETFPPNFARQWMDALQFRAESMFPGYAVHWEPGHNPDKPTSKAYMYEAFGIPAITFELGDESDREFIDVYTAVAAEEMMKNLLAFIEK